MQDRTELQISWEEKGESQTALYLKESFFPAPKKYLVADDTLKADRAYQLACEGTGLIWRGDFQNAQQLLQAMSRRNQKSQMTAPKKFLANTSPEIFHRHRQAQSQRARTLAALLIPFLPDFSIPLKRAPDASLALQEVFEIVPQPFVLSLRELKGIIGAHEWRKKGILIPELNEVLLPHYGVFSPLRGEYLQLIQQAPLPTLRLAFDIGCGTGVIAALLAKRGVQQIVATDIDDRALTCAQQNIQRLHLAKQITLEKTDLFPPGKAPLIVCNPPWLPARPSSRIENAVYDEDSKMLRGFLLGLAAHLEPEGEGWLILSDLAEHLGLRTRQELEALFQQAGLLVIEKIDTRPKHAKVFDQQDPLHHTRSQEVTSLWRLRRKID